MGHWRATAATAEVTSPTAGSSASRHSQPAAAPAAPLSSRLPETSRASPERAAAAVETGAGDGHGRSNRGPRRCSPPRRTAAGRKAVGIGQLVAASPTELNNPSRASSATPSCSRRMQTDGRIRAAEQFASDLRRIAEESERARRASSATCLAFRRRQTAARQAAGRRRPVRAGCCRCAPTNTPAEQRRGCRPTSIRSAPVDCRRQPGAAGAAQPVLIAEHAMRGGRRGGCGRPRFDEAAAAV